MRKGFGGGHSRKLPMILGLVMVSSFLLLVFFSMNPPPESRLGHPKSHLEPAARSAQAAEARVEELQHVTLRDRDLRVHNDAIPPLNPAVPAETMAIYHPGMGRYRMRGDHGGGESALISAATATASASASAKAAKAAPIVASSYKSNIATDVNAGASTEPRPDRNAAPEVSRAIKFIVDPWAHQGQTPRQRFPTINRIWAQRQVTLLQRGQLHLASQLHGRDAVEALHSALQTGSLARGAHVDLGLSQQQLPAPPDKHFADALVRAIGTAVAPPVPGSASSSSSSTTRPLRLYMEVSRQRISSSLALQAALAHPTLTVILSRLSPGSASGTDHALLVAPAGSAPLSLPSNLVVTRPLSELQLSRLLAGRKLNCLQTIESLDDLVGDQVRSNPRRIPYPIILLLYIPHCVILTLPYLTLPKLFTAAFRI